MSETKTTTTHRTVWTISKGDKVIASGESDKPPALLRLAARSVLLLVVTGGLLWGVLLPLAIACKLMGWP